MTGVVSRWLDRLFCHTLITSSIPITWLTPFIFMRRLCHPVIPSSMKYRLMRPPKVTDHHLPPSVPLCLSLSKFNSVQSHSVLLVWEMKEVLYVAEAFSKDETGLRETFKYTAQRLDVFRKEEFALLIVLDEPQVVIPAICLRGCNKERRDYI